MEAYRKVRDEVLLHQNLDPDDKPISFLKYAKYALINGAAQEKRDIILAFNKQLYIRDRSIVSTKIYSYCKGFVNQPMADPCNPHPA